MHKLVAFFRSLNREVFINIFIVVFYFLGAIGLERNFSRDFFISVMPYSLLMVSALLFLVHYRWSYKHFLVFLLIILFGFGIEVAGVYTGDIFGEYSYGRALGVRFMGTPPLIGLNWLMLIYCVYLIINKTGLPVFLKIPAGGLLMVIYDVIMEPVAIRLDMWSWSGDIIPMQNYVAWFVISSLMLSVFYVARLHYINRVAFTLFFSQIGFFILLNVILRM